MLVLNLQIQKNRIRMLRPEYLTSGSVNIASCSFEFDENWDGYEKVAVFEINDEKYEQLIVGNECPIPNQVLASPERVSLGVFGVNNDKTVTTNIIRLSVNQGANKDGQEAPEYQPTLLEQLLQEVLEVKSIAQSVRDDADAGKFNGEKGDDGFSPTAKVEETEDGAEIVVTDNTGTTTAKIYSDKNFVYTQGVASDIWEIKHSLNKFPAVTVIDSAGSAVIGEVTYLNTNKIKISFSGAFSGKAFLN